MATFLQLVNDVERESGTVDVRFNATTDVTATPSLRQQKIVEWVREAWNTIQVARSDWRFMRAEFVASLVPGTSRYAASALGITDFAQWPAFMDDGYEPFALQDPVIGARDQMILRHMEYQHWRARWGRNAPDSARPVNWSVDQNNLLCVGPPPLIAYVITGDYIRSTQVLAVNSDVPRIPAQYHDMIVYRALMLLGDHDEAASVIVPAKAKFDQAYRTLVNNSTEQASF